jgi:hypothetical protein
MKLWFLCTALPLMTTVYSCIGFQTLFFKLFSRQGKCNGPLDWPTNRPPSESCIPLKLSFRGIMISIAQKLILMTVVEQYFLTNILCIHAMFHYNLTNQSFRLWYDIGWEIHFFYLNKWLKDQCCFHIGTNLVMMQSLLLHNLCIF